MAKSVVKKISKRIFDIIISFLLMVLLLPIMALIALLIYLKMGAPIFFTQQRVGKNSEIFKIIKFRTMNKINTANKSDEARLTSFGKFLRSTSFDELPELWNVFKGEMSLVGPRPLLVQYLPLYSKEQARRHEMLPGITGWAQVNGRNAIGWEEKFKLDVFYIDNQNFWFDIKILFLTIWKIIKRDGISAKGEATMPFFTGENKDKAD